MLTGKQIGRMLSKLQKFEELIGTMLFEPVDQIEMKWYMSPESLDSVPDTSLFTECKSGDTWSGEGVYCWFRGNYQIPDRLQGRDLFLWPRTGGYEGMLFVNGVPSGTYASKIVVEKHGNHYCDLICQNAKAGETLDLALECYAGHYIAGCDPWSKNEFNEADYTYRYDKVQICVKNELFNQFYFDLKTVNEMVSCLPEDSFRRANLIKTLTDVHQILYYSVNDVDRALFMERITMADEMLKQELAKKNGPSAPFAGLIGHSHMDTAWLWHKGETLKKCARTYSNEISLMKQYPEYKFIQSSAYHSDMMRRHYPELFAEMQKYVAEKRYEPNGGVWIECDCNITSGESMIRQFLWGQRFTRKYFNYTADCFWLPDTFGYSASIPQIMKGCHVDYFLTTKMEWNDTTKFPYDTFYWEGIDGTRVFTHFNRTHIWPDAKALMAYVVNGEDSIKEKTVSDKRLLSYGFGDGGGGPQFEMIEMARRVQDTEGIPRSKHMLVSDFMKELEETSKRVSVYQGELYLELHRGTLTNKHVIKQNNRMSERCIHNLEFLTAKTAVEADKTADGGKIAPYVKTLLINQFHDILPGTCIPRAHEESVAETTKLIAETGEMIRELLPKSDDSRFVSLTNPLSFDRTDVIYLDWRDGMRIKGDYAQQHTEDVHGNQKLAVYGVTVPAYGTRSLEWECGDVKNDASCFVRNGNVLTTPHEVITFDENGFISSFVDRAMNRELRGDGYALNTFLMAEDLPNFWDNWDIDADIEMKFHDCAKRLSSELISAGAVEYRIRNTYQISEKSKICQDMIVHAENMDITFETVMDWQDDHRFLKTAFDVTVFSDFARHEIQFGCIKRPTSRNTAQEKAKFEVCNHKYTDLSENRYGVSILNDCKYGISVNGSHMRLSLHKGGVRPDFNGDHGTHCCTYTFHPHNGGFNAVNVVRPAYELNYPALVSDGAQTEPSFVSLDAENVMIETIKPCEDAQKAYILRLYETEGAYANVKLHFAKEPKQLYLTDMLEEPTGSCKKELTFRPFEIKTVKVVYGG